MKDLDMSDVEADAQRMADVQQEREDAEMIAAGRDRVEAEIAAEDARESEGPSEPPIDWGVAREVEELDDEDGIALVSIRGRLLAWLQSQPDVAEAEQISDQVFGFVLAGVGDMSLSIHPTGDLNR